MEMKRILKMTNNVLENEFPNYISFATYCCEEGKKKWYKTLNKHKYYFEVLIQEAVGTGHYYCGFELEKLLIEDAVRRNKGNYKQLKKDLKEIKAFIS